MYSTPSITSGCLQPGGKWIEGGDRPLGLCATGDVVGVLWLDDEVGEYSDVVLVSDEVYLGESVACVVDNVLSATSL